METKTIKDVFIKTGVKGNREWTRYDVQFTDGTKTSTFDKNIATLRGKTIECELTQEGQYTNLGVWNEVVDKPENPMKVSPPQPVTQPSKGDSIEAQVAVKEIGMAMREKLEVPNGLVALYWGWIGHALGGVIPQPITSSVKTIQEAPKQAPIAKKTAPKQEPDPSDLPF